MTIFLSHASVDGDAVRSLVRHLESAGSTVWLDQDLTGGEAWWSAILGQIRECEIFVFALSENALQSDACQLELTYARDLGLPILPVQIGDEVRIRKGPYEQLVVVRGLADKRGPAKVAQGLYEETAESLHEREMMSIQLKSAPETSFRTKGRPTKRERRDIEKFKRGKGF